MICYGSWSVVELDRFKEEFDKNRKNYMMIIEEDDKNEKENMMIIEGDTIYCEDCGRDMIIATIREEAGSKVIHYHCRKCGSEVGDKVATEEEMDRLKHWVLD